MISSTSSRRINHAYLSELRELVDLLDRVMDVMTAVTKVDYCSHFLVYGFATFFGISGAVWTHSRKFLLTNLSDGLWDE